MQIKTLEGESLPLTATPYKRNQGGNGRGHHMVTDYHYAVGGAPFSKTKDLQATKGGIVTLIDKVLPRA